MNNSSFGVNTFYRDYSKNPVSDMTPHPDISGKTVYDNTPVKRKKHGFEELSGRKSDRQSVGQG